MDGMDGMEGWSHARAEGGAPQVDQDHIVVSTVASILAAGRAQQQCEADGPFIGRRWRAPRLPWR
jgi:hypothetical protein